MVFAATSFSITIVALQLASSNFGPRMLRNFMRDTGNQIVLGTFISTFIYCLLVLRTIHGEGDGYSVFVPQLSVTVGMILAIASIGVLIYFIHHAATIIQASHVISEVSADLDDAIKRLFPEKIGHGASQHKRAFGEISANFAAEFPIKATNSGYIQAIDDEKLMKIACEQNLLLRLKYRPRKFVVKGSDLVMIFPEKRVNLKLTTQITAMPLFWGRNVISSKMLSSQSTNWLKLLSALFLLLLMIRSRQFGVLIASALDYLTSPKKIFLPRTATISITTCA